MWIIGEFFLSLPAKSSFPASTIYRTSLLETDLMAVWDYFWSEPQWATRAKGYFDKSRYCLCQYKVINKLLTTSQEGLRTHRHFSLNNLSTHTSFTSDFASAVRRGQGRSLQDCTKHRRLRLRCCKGCCSSPLLFQENPLPSPPTIRVQLLLRVRSSSLQNLLLLFCWSKENKHVAPSRSEKQGDGCWEGWELG